VAVADSVPLADLDREDLRRSEVGGDAHECGTGAIQFDDPQTEVNRPGFHDCLGYWVTASSIVSPGRCPASVSARRSQIRWVSWLIDSLAALDSIAFHCGEYSPW
jgi:hypothetical protein